MKKNIPSFQPFEKQLPPAQPEEQKVFSQTREYTLITPLFGGGVNPSEVDTLTPIRGSEIRGHLRFWWRACRGGQFVKNLQKMKQKENEIWGKAHKKGEDDVLYDETVQIRVETTHVGSRYDSEGYLYSRDPNAEPPPDQIVLPVYATFPLRPQKGEFDAAPKYVQRGVKFTIQITFPKKHEKEIKAAFWAWETFGGIGARTRRGFGALRLTKINGEEHKDLPANDTEMAVRKWIGEKLDQYIDAEAQFPDNVPHLTREPRLEIFDCRSSAEGAWNDLIVQLAKFRQPGRDKSRWPESNEARAILNDNKNREGESVDSENTKVYTFPKAVLGLPIVFQLPQDETPALQEKAKGKERLASPLILRPLFINNQRAVGLALLLLGNGIHSDGLELIPGKKDQPAYKATITTTLEQEQAEAISVLQGRGTDVLLACIDWLRENRHIVSEYRKSFDKKGRK